jgi:glycosyltransferase involved in cell wall biosynthesis
VNFGFPSKVAEAFCMGVPIISNGYSDIALYLKSDCNGVLVDEDNVQSLRDCLIHCENTSDSDRQAMREEARKTGEKFFSDSAAGLILTRMLQA